MVPKQRYKKGSFVQLLTRANNTVRLSPNDRKPLSKLVEEAEENIADIGENDNSISPQVTLKGKSEEAIPDDPFSSLMRELTELVLGPVEMATKRKEILMRKMIKNYIWRKLLAVVCRSEIYRLQDTRRRS